MKTVLVCAVLLFGVLDAGALLWGQSADRLALASLIGNVAGAAGRVYSAVDSAGHSMDCLKIIEDPTTKGRFLGVYHCYFEGGGTAYVCLAESNDLLHWTFLRILAGAPGATASQPTIRTVGSGFMTAWEQEPSNHIKLSYFPSVQALEAGLASKTMDCRRTLSVGEGTPNLYAADINSAEVGFHYYMGGTVDRQARGVMKDWNSWTVQKEPTIDEAIQAWGVNSNIGDRDSLTFRGREYLVIEGGGQNRDFSTWRIYLYDIQEQNAYKLNLRTDGGSPAACNPTASIVTLGDRKVLVCTAFVPSENAAPGESRAMIWYNDLEQAWAQEAVLKETLSGEGSRWRFPDALIDGTRSVLLNFTVDNNAGPDDVVAVVIVKDETSGKVLASRDMTTRQVFKAFFPEVLRLDFVLSKGGSVLVEVQSTGLAQVTTSSVSIR